MFGLNILKILKIFSTIKKPWITFKNLNIIFSIKYILNKTFIKKDFLLILFSFEEINFKYVYIYIFSDSIH